MSGTPTARDIGLHDKGASGASQRGARSSTTIPEAVAERILVLDGQTTQALACARSLGRAGATILVASVRRRPLAAWSRYCADCFTLPGESLATYAQLREWAHEQRATLVLPMTERSCLLLNAEREAWHRSGILVGTPEPDVLAGAFDKMRTLEVAQSAGVAVPPMRVPRSIAECRTIAAELGLPCVVKARFTTTWDGEALWRDTGTSYVRTLPELEAAVRRHRHGGVWPIVQRYVGGAGKGIFTVCDRGRPLAWFAHERLRDVRPTGSGSSLRRAAPVEPRLREPAERLLHALAWHGPAMVEFRDDGVVAPQLMEVNGRFWGSLQLAVSAGVDFPRLWVATLRGMPVEVPDSYRQDVTLRWVWGDVKRLLYVMKGRPAGFPGAFPSRATGLREILGPQPAGTRSEMWQRIDPWPALGEWMQGLGELLTYRRQRRPRTAERPDGTRHAHQPTAAEGARS